MEFEELELMATEDEFAMEESDSSPPASKEKEGMEATANQYEEMEAEDFCYAEEDKRCNKEKGVDLKMEEKLRRRKERFGGSRDEEESSSSKADSERYSSKRNSQKRSKGRSSNTSSFNKSRLLKPLYETDSLSSEILGREIAYRLEEKKTLVIKNVVKILGSHTAMDLFKETVQIQKAKGMKTADGKRRRSSGGVYLYLLKQRANKEEWDKIFKEDKVINKQKDKMKKEIAKKERLEQMKKELINNVDKIYGIGNQDTTQKKDSNESKGAELQISGNDELA